MDASYFNFIKSSIETNDVKNMDFMKNVKLENKYKTTKHSNIEKNENTIQLYDIEEDVNILRLKHDIFIIEMDEDNNAIMRWCWSLPYLSKQQSKCSLELFLWARNQSNLSGCLKELLLTSNVNLGRNTNIISLKITILISISSMLLKATAPIVKNITTFEYKKYLPVGSSCACYSIIYDS